METQVLAILRDGLEIVNDEMREVNEDIVEWGSRRDTVLTERFVNYLEDQTDHLEWSLHVLSKELGYMTA
jgi:hypothetical protein